MGVIFTLSSMGSMQRIPSRQHHVVPPLQRRQAGNLRNSRAAAAEHVGSTETMALVDEIPVVDLAQLLSDYPSDCQRVAAACRDWGFFQVINHGVSMELVRKIRKQSLAVFALPPEQKNAVSRRRSRGSQWGYDFRPDHGPLEVFQMNPWDHQQLIDYALNLFPGSSEEFVAVYEEANLAFRKLAMEILDIMIQGLRVDARHFQAHKKESQGVLRANYYHKSKGAEQVLGLIPHVDGNLLTILHQQDVSGLEVLKDGRWIPVLPRTDSFCVNVADILQVLSNGQYRSIQHRAIVPTTDARMSIAYFLTPAASVPLQAAPELVASPQRPAVYRPFTWAEFVDASKDPGRPYPSVLPFFEEPPPSQPPLA